MTDAYQWENGWTCPVCKLTRSNDDDPCIPGLPGVKYACCGHGGMGINEGYLYFENGVRIGMIVTSISYDDGKARIDVPDRARVALEGIFKIARDSRVSSEMVGIAIRNHLAQCTHGQ